MLQFVRILKYRPTRTDDAEGGSTEVRGAAVELWGVIRAHESELRLICRTEEDIVNQDQVFHDDAYYRVVGRVGHHRGPFVTYSLNRVDKPIVP